MQGVRVTSHGSPRSSLRPEWVFQVARELEAFARSEGAATSEPPGLEGFLSALPPPEAALERQLLDALRDALSRAPGRQGPPARAELARRLLAAEYRRPWTLAELARAAGCNRTTLQEEFQRLTGTTVHRYLVQQRVSAARHLLRQSDLKVSCVAREVGYRSPGALARHFKSITGVTPTSYRVTPGHGSAADPGVVPVDRAPLLP
jgi:AraC-like DNA-binding protein